MFRQSSDFHEIMKSSYYPRLRKNAKKVPISDCLFSFDIETTSWTENWSTMYSWAFGAAEYKDIVKCKCNQDLEYITLIKMGRTWSSFDEWLVKINNIASELGRKYIILVYNLGFEWSYLQKNIKFIRNNYLPDYPTVIEGKHNIMSIQAGNLVFLDAQRLFGLGSLKQNAAKYGFEKYEYDYDRPRHSSTPLTNEEKRYNINDVLITLGCWCKYLYSNGFEHIHSAPITGTTMIKEILKRNKEINKVIEKREVRNKKAGIYRTVKRDYTLFDDAVNISKSVLPENIDEIAPLLESAFAGGFSHCNIFAQGNLYYNVFSADLGSAYPGAMQTIWFPRKLEKAKDANIMLYKYMKLLRGKYKNYMELAKGTREKLDLFAVVDVELVNVSVKVYKNELGKVTIPLISKHKIISHDTNALFDNGKLIECRRIRIKCTTIDLLTWDYVYNYKIRYCFELYAGTDIQQVPAYWLNAIDYCYQAKTVLKNTVRKYTNNEDWESEYRKLAGIDDVEINHVKSLEVHEAIQYLNMVLMQRKGELNGLYGIMVMHIMRQSYTYTDEAEIEPTEIEIRKPKDGTCYLWGIIITAIVRLWEVTFSLYLTDNHCLPVYWDTDSVKAYTKQKDIVSIVKQFNDYVGAVNNKYPALGAYDYEGTYYAFKSLGAKRYIVLEKSKKTGFYEWESTIAGLPKRVFSGFLTQELQKAVEYMPFNEAVDYSAYYFKPNIFIDESATSKLIPRYVNVENMVEFDCVDYKGVHKIEKFWPGARLSGIQFAIMDMKTIENKIYQTLCERKQGKIPDEYEPLTIYKEGNLYKIKDGRLDVPDMNVFIAQKDVKIYI